MGPWLRQPPRPPGERAAVTYVRRHRFALLLGVILLTAACNDAVDSTGGVSASTTTATATTVATTPAAPATSTPGTTAPATTVPATTTPAATTRPPALTTTPAEPLTVSAYFIRAERVATAHRSVEHTVATSKAAVEQLLAGPSDAEIAIGYSTSVPDGTTLNGIRIDDGISTVDLSAEFASGGGSLSVVTRMAQLVYTATQFPDVDGMLLEIDGEPVTELGGEGFVIDRPLTRADFEDQTPIIFVESPAPFDRVGSPLRITGTANVFEAVFQIRLQTTGGDVLYEHNAMASSGTGTRGTFDVTIEFDVPAGNGLLTLWETSAKDGSPTNVVEIPVVFSLG